MTRVAMQWSLLGRLDAGGWVYSLLAIGSGRSVPLRARATLILRPAVC